MRKTAGGALLGLAGATTAGVVLLAVSLPASGQDKADAARVAIVKHIMKGIHQPHCGGIGELLEGDGPKDDKAWDELALHAALLNESGHLLMQNQRCPSAVWAGACAKLRTGASAVFAAAAKKDAGAARAAFKNVTASCGACHAAHKNKLPERFAGVKHLMAGLNQPNCGAIGEAIKGDGPKDDDAWAAVFQQAALLNEAGHLLMANNRCPDSTWAGAATALRQAAGKIGQAARARNLEGMRTSFRQLIKACGACHKAHKK